MKRAPAIAVAASVLTVCATLPAVAQVALTPSEAARIAGVWEKDPVEHSVEERGDFTCIQRPSTVEISEDGTVYRSGRDGAFTAQSDVLAKAMVAGAFAIHIQYYDESRLDDAGNPVSWWLVSPDPDHFYWVRSDWVDTGGRTSMRRRCGDPIS